MPLTKNKGINRELKDKIIGLADVSDKTDEIDLIIGADVGGELLTGKILEIETGLVTLDSRFGWTTWGKQKKNDIKNIPDQAIVAISQHIKIYLYEKQRYGK